MVELFFWPTPNGMKVLMFLAEAGMDYRITSVNINEGEQFSNEFLQIAPNGRIPAIIDHAPTKSSETISIFESGAILIYLAEKVGRFLPDSLVERTDVLQWLMWQMGGLGPMLGQNHHFTRYAPEEVPYATRRYHQETSRLYAVLDGRLAESEFICNEYSIADMACYPWILRYEWHKTDIDQFPNVKRWLESIRQRPAVVAAYREAEKINKGKAVTSGAQKILFGQDATTMRKAMGTTPGSGN